MFLPTLYTILSEQSSYLKTQPARLKSMWKDLWQSVAVELPEMRLLHIEKDRFFNDLNYRIECVEILRDAMTDGYYLIKAIVDALFNQYIQKGIIQQDFSETDTIPVSFLISEILVGSLLQFIVLDKTPIPIGFLIISKNKAIMKLKGRSISQIYDDLRINGFNTTIDEVNGVMQEMQELGYVTPIIDKPGMEPKYKFIKDFTLSPEGNQVFLKKIKLLLEFAVELWRSLYNIRSIDTIIPDFYPFRDFLVETVKRAATQGYINAHSVMENIVNYYKLCIENNMKVP